MTDSIADPRDMPRYSVPEVAAYVRVKPRTLSTWIRGRSYPAAEGAKESPAVIVRPSDQDPRLSYNNLVEAYVLNVLRRHMGIRMADVRRGLQYVEETFDIPRFLLSDKLRVRRGNLIIQALGQYINVGAGGQAEIPEVVMEYLRRIRYEHGFPVGLHPVTRPDHPTGPQRIVILPDVGFGKPVTTRQHISTAVIASRFGAGESVEELADDYQLEALDVEEAIRTERLQLAA